ncbi:uncharacterized protein [Rutidosis leptorrhynchoides]|uniref:uncharacterized protein n=1 Tax=Rutidosis leptorrhynchoides TaxID=125765 RepID=UPI003A996AB2
MTRSYTKSCVFHKIGDGLKTSAWHDKWNVIGPLNDIVSARDLYDARFSKDLKVADLIQDNKWVWPDDWLIRFPWLQMLQVPVFNANMKDEVVWVTNDGSKVKYSKLMTQDRMLKWNATGNYACPLCGTCPDSHSHLFFECVFAKTVWISMKKKKLFRGLSNNLVDIVQNLANYHFRKDIWGVINRFTVAAVVYHIWQERNGRIFNKPPRNENDLVKIIKDNIEMQLLTLKVKENNAVKVAAKGWGFILFSIFSVAFLGVHGIFV